MPLRDDLLAPIPGANPSGINLRYDPVTDKVKEARREEFEAPQGVWKSVLKTADYPQVIKLAGDAIAKRSKDLQLAVWLVDAHVRREHFSVLPACFEFLRDLCDQFWETMYPEVEAGDLEVRAAPLSWLGSKLDEPIRLLPITSSGLSWFRYRESRTVGYEEEAMSEEKRKSRNQLISEGKISADEFDQAIAATQKSFFEERFDSIGKALSALEEFTAFLDEKFGEFSPSFIRVRTALEDNGQVVKGFINKKGGPTPAPPIASQSPTVAPELQPVTAPAQATVSGVDAVVAPSRSPVVSASSNEPRSVEEASKQLSAIAKFLRAKDVYDIAPYLILRGFRWGEIRYNGPEIDVSMLMPPDEQMRNDLASTFAAGRWDKVLELTEQAMELPCGRAWLDIQRYTVKALEGKGQYFAFVADAVRTAVRGLIQDLPGLMQMSLRDNSAGADSDTRNWIENEVLAGVTITLAASANGTVANHRNGRSELRTVAPPPIEIPLKPLQMDDYPLTEGDPSEVFNEALRQAREGQTSEAIAILRNQLATERSGRARFKRRVQIAHVLMASGREQVAEPILDQIASEIESRRLEEWEDGEAVAYPLFLLLRCVGADEEMKRRIYSAICRLDPARALQITV